MATGAPPREYRDVRVHDMPRHPGNGPEAHDVAVLRRVADRGHGALPREPAPAPRVARTACAVVRAVERATATAATSSAVGAPLVMRHEASAPEPSSAVIGSPP